MNRKEAIRQNEQSDTLQSLGFTAEEAESLRRISMTLRRWHERECGDGNGCIEYDGEGVPHWLNAMTGKTYRIPTRETGARKRLAKILKARNSHREWCSTQTPISPGAILERGPCNCGKQAPVSAYIQTDPRGAALYILRPGDVPEDSTVESCYSRGICVY